MSDTIFVTQLKINGESVYRREKCRNPGYETIELKQFIADAMTGEEVKE